MHKGDREKCLSKEVSTEGRLLPSLVPVDDTTWRWWTFLPPFFPWLPSFPPHREGFTERVEMQHGM